MSSVVVLNSCENEDKIEYITDSTEQRILLSKVTTVYYNNPANPQTSVATLEHNNQGQLIKISSENRITTLEYNNAGKLFKTIYYLANGTIDYYTSYTYNGDELKTVKAIYTNTSYNRTTTYIYTNGKVTNTNLCQSTNCSNPSTNLYTYNGENISTEISSGNGISGISTIKREFLYDNKKNPYSLINKDFRISVSGGQFLSENNYTSEKISQKDSSGNWVQLENINYEIQYNSAHLPIQIVGKTTTGANYVKYSYEYVVQ